MISVVGIGPGGREGMTLEALSVIERAEVIVGYVTYIRLIEELIEGKTVVSNGMRAEVDRCKEAIEIARTGKHVAVISSGDAGIYGMAGLIYELSDGQDEVEVIAGVTASSAAAAILGAPLMHDFCNISLSDLLTPYDKIMKRVSAASEADFIICLYNPRSKGRSGHLMEAVSRIIAVQGPDVPVGLVKDAGREGQTFKYCTLGTMDEDFVDMTTVVVIGNSQTKMIGGKMVTPRGYQV